MNYEKNNSHINDYHRWSHASVKVLLTTTLQPNGSEMSLLVGRDSEVNQILLGEYTSPYGETTTEDFCALASDLKMVEITPF